MKMRESKKMPPELARLAELINQLQDEFGSGTPQKLSVFLQSDEQVEKTATGRFLAANRRSSFKSMVRHIRQQGYEISVRQKATIHFDQ